MRRVMNSKLAERVRERIADGELCTQIARDLNLSTTTIYNIRDNRYFAGVGPDVSTMTRPAKTQETVRLLKELAETHSISEAASIIGMVPSAVHVYARAYSIRFVQGKRGPKHIRIVREIQRVLYREGYTDEQIEAFKTYGR